MPPSGGQTPSRSLESVVLPAPLAPMMAVCWPRAMWKERSWRIPCPCRSVRQEFGSSEAAAPLAHVFWQIAELSKQGLEDEEPDTEVDAAELVCRHAADQERKKDEQEGGIEEICHRIAPRIALGEAQVAREQLVCRGGKALRGRSGPRADQLVGAACCVEQSAAVGCIARASLAFICMATENGETQAYKAEDGQEQGEGA